MNENKVMVIGAGTMGNGIAQIFAAKGYEVLMVDVASEMIERGLKTVRRVSAVWSRRRRSARMTRMPSWAASQAAQT